MAAAATSSAAAWVAALKKAKKTCMVSEGHKKIHFTFEDGAEMVEEWSVKGDLLRSRKWRGKATLGGSKPWEYEVGEDSLLARGADEKLGLSVSNSNPVCIRQDVKKEFQWRIRNLPYDLDVYALTVSEDGHQFVLRTSNKKYYKKFEVPDLRRAGLTIEADSLSMAHANSTLIISLAKPPAFIAMEATLKQLREGLKGAEEGDVDCAQQ